MEQGEGGGGGNGWVRGRDPERFNYCDLVLFVLDSVRAADRSVYDVYSCAVLCSAVQCSALQCCAVLGFAVLCCAVLCRLVLCYVASSALCAGSVHAAGVAY